MNINIEIKGQQANITNKRSLISGTNNLEEITFDFSSEWNQFVKTAVIYVNKYSTSNSVKILVENDKILATKLPSGLFKEECNLYIGVFGDNAEGKRITSTVVCQKIKEGVPVDVVNEVTPDIYNQIINIMSETKSLVAEVNEKVELNKSYLEQTQQKANEASESAMRAENSENNINSTVNAFDEISETKKTELINIADAKMTDINTLADAKIKDLDSVSGAKSNDIATLTTVKMEDITNVTNAKLNDINNTALSQIQAINNSAVEAGKGQIKGITSAAVSQIDAINNKGKDQITSINTVTQQQLANINRVAQSQIEAINNVAISQSEALKRQYNEMCKELGLDIEGVLDFESCKTATMDVSKYKYIKFGSFYGVYPSGNKINDTTLPPAGYEWCSAYYASKTFGEGVQDLKLPEDAVSITSNKEYDISNIDILYFVFDWVDRKGLQGHINYKLYNKSETEAE